MLKRGCLLVVFFIGSLVLLPLTGGAPISAAEKEAEKKQDVVVEPKESFNLILPFKDVTVGQGQEVTMDRSEEHTSELQSLAYLLFPLLL